jgi:predicted Ser/Thr protein kinase
MTELPDRHTLQRMLDGDLPPQDVKRISRMIAENPSLLDLLDDMTRDAPLDRGRTHTPKDPALRVLLQQMRETSADALGGEQPRGRTLDDDEPLIFPEAPTERAPLGRLGPYNIIRLLGEGSTGLLYEAYDTKLDRIVAIKVLRRDLAALAAARARFDREARAAAALIHDHIVTVYDVGFMPDFPPFFVMEYINGRSLRENIRRHRFEISDAVRLTRQVALGLDAAHSRGLIHRDVKPSNIMLDETTGRARITDFGLARSFRPGSDLTRDAAIAGTPAYMSPEQIATPEQIDHRSDIYSLGAVMYELLTGARPFGGVIRMVLVQVLNDEPRPPRKLNDKLPRDVETVCLKAMDKNPDRRYQSGAEFAAELERLLNGMPIKARPTGAAERGWRWARRNPLPTSLVVLLVALMGGSMIAALKINYERQAALDAKNTAIDSLSHIAEQARQTPINDAQDAANLKSRIIDIAEEGIRRARDNPPRTVP